MLKIKTIYFDKFLYFLRIKVKSELVINMLKVELFSNYYNFLEKISLLVKYVSFATKIFNIFKS